MSGQIPIALETLPYLEVIDVSFNNLDCEVPLEGAFQNHSNIFLDGNFKLCGGMRILHLPACSSRKSPRNRKSHYLKILAIVLGIGACSIFVLTFLVLWYYRRIYRKDPSIEQVMEDEFLRLSYADLFTATQGFSLSNLLGTGQFSSVYKGILPFNGKQIAVKVLNLDLIGASESFISECEALRITRHRNLLKLITACLSVNFRCENFKALVFDFMQNRSLDLWLHHNPNDGLQEKSLDFTQRLNIAIGIASALDYLHNHCQPPIVHCDLKPSNVLLNEEMIPHVGDFGLARFCTLGTTNEEAGSIAIKGTIGYVPPEYGFGAQVSTEGDVYSYGILLLEMLTGKRPTDEMFSDGLSLHDYCNLAWPDRVEYIVDPRLVLHNRINANQEQNESILIKCLLSLLSIGLNCSAELPNVRMDMKNVVMKLKAVDEVFGGIRFNGGMYMRKDNSGEGPSQAG